MVTAETALVLPVLVVLLTVGLGAVSAVTAQLRCVDAAREAARSAARGDDPEQAREWAQRAAPAGASITIDVGADRVEVTVGVEVGIAHGLLPSVPVHATAVAVLEAGLP